MKSKAFAFLRLLMIPGGLILTAAVTLAHFYHFPPPVLAIFPWLPYAIVLPGVLLSMRFNCGRMMCALIMLVLISAVLTSYSWGRPDLISSSGTVFICVSLLAPINLMVLSMTPERGATRQVAVTWLLIILMEVGMVLALCTLKPAVMNEFLRASLFDWPFLHRSQLLQPALFAFTLAGFVLFVNFYQIRRPSEGGLFWTLVASFLVFNRPLPTPIFGFYCSVAAIIVIVSLVETSYHLAFLDELTGLPGRRAFHDATSRLGWNYTVAMVDVDHFKKFNDTYGHACGDQVLRLVANKLASAPGQGQAFRYGGEEFALIYPGKTTKQVLEYLDELRRQIAETKFKVRASERRVNGNGKGKTKGGPKKVQVTVSIGAANYGGSNNLFEKVLVAADKALYRAKDAGRNCVKC